MTACVNKKHTRRVALAISASLVGALSLGAAATPVFAEGNGISTLATEDAAVSKAEVEYRGEYVSEFTYNGRPQAPVPTKVTPVNEDTERVADMLPASADRKKGDFYYYYIALDGTSNYTPKGSDGSTVSYVDEKGNAQTVKGTLVTNDEGEYVKPTKQGTYAVVIGQYLSDAGETASWRYVATADTFEIVGQSLDDAVLIDGMDVNDTTFNYDGSKASNKVSTLLDRIHVSLDGRILTEGGDYTASIWEKGGKDDLGDSYQLDINKTYVVKVVGAGAFKGESVDIDFTLGKLQLDDAVVLGDVFAKVNASINNRPDKDTEAKDAVASINGVTSLDWPGLDDGGKLQLEFVSGPDGSSTSNEVKGAFTYKLVAPEGNKNVEGEATVTVLWANYKANVDFGNAGLFDPASNAYVVDLDDEKPDYFDLDEIAVTSKWSGAGTKAWNVPEEGYKVTVTDAAGNPGDLTKPGTYTVRVDVDYTFDDNGTSNWVAGQAVAKVVVAYDLEQDTDVFLSYDGQNVDESDAPYKKVYNGTDHVPHFSVVVKSAAGTLVEGADYTVSYEKIQDDGKVVEVDSIVDAGYYNVVVKGISFHEDYRFQFDVTPITIEGEVQVVSPYVKDKKPALAWTGEALTPEFRWDSNGDKKIDGSDEVIPSDAYAVEYVRDVDNDGIDETVELKDVAKDYTAYLETAEGVVNYDIDAYDTFEVTDAGLFSDVPTNGVWFSEYVNAAAGKGYMTGYNHTTLFGPNDTITRGDVAVTLFKMAGGTLEADQPPAGDPHEAFNTPFSDVDPEQYYAQAIQWAAKLGIVTGYDGTDLFKPEAAVSRQELATMMWRYAKVADLDAADVEADASALDAYTDGSAVADFADEAVAWAVEAEVMGQDVTAIRPADAITRAEVAAMTVRVQPEGRLNFDDMMDPNPAA